MHYNQQVVSEWDLECEDDDNDDDEEEVDGS